MPLQYPATKIRLGVLHFLQIDTAKIIHSFCNVTVKMRRKKNVITFTKRGSFLPAESHSQNACEILTLAAVVHEKAPS